MNAKAPLSLMGRQGNLLAFRGAVDLHNNYTTNFIKMTDPVDRLSIEKCREELGEVAKDMTDEQVKEVRDSLYGLAELALDTYFERCKIKAMKLNFQYDRGKDVWCLINKGKSSNNSANPTAVYQELVSQAGENPDEATTSSFIDNYLERNNLNPENFTQDYKQVFESISSDFQSVAERVFGVPLNRDITAYLTINTRCPYDLQEGSFFVSISKGNPAMTMMHELWHFYTWEKFGADEQIKLGKERYNDLKEALTVLLNVECRHLIPEGSEDKGYPQHRELREKIKQLWEQNPDIDFVWKEAQTVH